MSEKTFTPGPWESGWGNGLTGPTTPAVTPFCGGIDWDYEPVRSGEETIAVCPAQSRAGDYLANARLIAAAPDLLKALQGVIRHFGVTTFMQDVPEFNAVRAAISRATGQGEDK